MLMETGEITDTDEVIWRENKLQREPCGTERVRLMVIESVQDTTGMFLLSFLITEKMFRTWITKVFDFKSSYWCS